MKKLLSCLMCAGLVCVGSMNVASAADGINAEEQRLLDYLTERGMTAGGETLILTESDELYQSVYEILAADGIDLTAAEVDTVRDSAKDVEAYLNKFPTDQEMTAEIMSEVVRLASPAVGVLDLKLSYDPIKDVLTLSTLDGEIINQQTGLLGTKKEDIIQKPKTDTKLEKTGENFTSTYAIIGSLGLVLAAAGMLTFKKKQLEA